jgi:hypothetical protein
MAIKKTWTEEMTEKVKAVLDRHGVFLRMKYAEGSMINDIVALFESEVELQHDNCEYRSYCREKGFDP